LPVRCPGGPLALGSQDHPVHEDIKMELVYLGGIFIFGIIYWLISRVEARK
jgi:hypothetical protein